MLPKNNALMHSIKNFLANSPQNMPESIQQMFESLLNQDISLPPHIFYEVVEQSDLAISITDLKANILYVNKAFEKVTGYTSQEVLGFNESLLSDKKTPKNVYKDLWKQIQARKTWKGSLLNRKKNGERYLAQVTIAPILNPIGETLYYLAVHQDITHLYQIEQQAKNQQSLIESVVNVTPVATVVLDEKENIILSNKMYKQFTKISFIQEIKKVLGQEWEILKAHYGKFTDKELEMHLGASEKGRYFLCSGAWFLEYNSSADNFFEKEQEKPYFLLIIKEITEIKRQQEQVENNAMRALLSEHEIIANMQETLAGAIHQFQKPLNMLKATLNILEQRGDKNGTYHALQAVLMAGETIVNQMHNKLPNIEEEVYTELNINTILRDVLSVLTEKLLANGITVDWKPALVLPQLLGQKNRLRILFKNIMDNAIDAMKGLQPALLQVITEVQEETIIIKISDTGKGIETSDQYKVFEPFYSTKNSIGMGLNTAQEIVNQHHGHLYIDNDYTSGCRFIIELYLK